MSLFGRNEDRSDIITFTLNSNRDITERIVKIEVMMTLLKDEVVGMKTEMGTRFDELDRRLKPMESDISVLKSDVSILKSDVSILKSDVSILKSDVSVLKSDVSVLKKDVSEIKDSQKHYFRVILGVIILVLIQGFSKNLGFF